MAQILVTLDDDSSMQSIRRAISLLRGVVSTSIFKGEETTQKRYVRESLERAVGELRTAKEIGRQLQSATDFIQEMKLEEES